MAQHDYSIANQGFPATRADINNVLSAIATNNSGTSAPSTQFAGQFWIDTTSSTWTLYIYDGADDIQFATIDTSANTVNFTDSALDVVTDSSPQLGGNLDLNSNNITGTGNIDNVGTITTDGLTVAGNVSVDGGTIKLDGNYPVGSSNVALGNQALDDGSLSGNSNTAIGSNSLTNNTTGTENVSLGSSTLDAVTTGSFHTGLGAGALGAVTTGTRHVGVGQGAGGNIQTGTGGIYVGMATSASSTSANYEIVVGYSTTGKGGQTGFINPIGGGVYQGNNSSTWSTTSDRRIKKNITDNTIGLEKINQIQVKNFEYRTPEEITEVPQTSAIEKQGVQVGVIAQEIEEILPDVVKTETTGVKSVNPDNITWYLVNAIKELKKEIDELKNK